MTQGPENLEATPQDNLAPRHIGSSDLLTESESNNVIQRLGSLVLPEDTELRPHQQEAFDKVVDFYASGGREGYVLSPTSTGKTVLFVEVINRQIEAAREKGLRSRAIVLVPKKDLVNQTVGSVDQKTGKRRGFVGFAPNLDARPLHSQIPDKQKTANILESDVLVTTYDMFRNMIATVVEGETKTEAEWSDERILHMERFKAMQIEKRKIEWERGIFTEEAFDRQEVERARKIANEQLKKYIDKPDDPVKKHAQTILDIVDNDTGDEYPARSNREKMNQLRKATRKMISQPAVIKLNRMTEQYDKKIKNKSVFISSESDAAEEIAIANDLNDELLETHLPLTDFDKYIVNFVWRHRRNRPANDSDIKGQSDRSRLLAYRDRLDEIRQAITYSKGRTKSIENTLVVQTAFKEFDLMICDEAHRVMGSETWDAIRDYAKIREIAILGTTATDKYLDRNLQQFFETKIHELSRQDAIRDQIVNPVAMFVRETGLDFRGVQFDPSGDYDKETIKAMRFNPERNGLIVDDMQMLSELGYRGIVTAIAGGGGAHAILLANLAQEREFLDPRTGRIRKLLAEFVLGTIDGSIRSEYYKRLEEGTLDWITAIDVANEGVDIDNAKALINARPTRSPLLATQRAGRVGRTFPGAPASVVIDYLDKIEFGNDDGERTSIPPVLVSDIFEVDNVAQGHIVGELPEHSRIAIETIKERMPTPVIESLFSRYANMYKDAMVIEGYGNNRDGMSNRGWRTYDALLTQYKGYLPKEILLDATSGDNPSVRTAGGRGGRGRIVPLFNVDDVKRLHADSPKINPMKLFVDDSGEKWITPEGCKKMISLRFPSVQVEDIVDAVRAIESTTDQPFEKMIGRLQINFGNHAKTNQLGFTHMFKLDEINTRLLPYLSK